MYFIKQDLEKMIQANHARLKAAAVIRFYLLCFRMYTDLMSDDIFFLSSFHIQNDSLRLYNYYN